MTSFSVVLKILEFLGGLGMFLYGMKIMGDGLEKAAGNKIQVIIEKLTGNLYKGILMGAVVTGVIQSSSATTVMVVGFVNAGIMNLSQAVGVIMGANIGTTVTAQIIRLGDISSNTWYFSLLRPDTLAPIAMITGAAILMFNTKNKKRIVVGEILAGFAILFIGMKTMETSVSLLKDLPAFATAFAEFGKNPILGILVGALVTAVIQSSSASVGILQAAAASGLVTFGTAVPIIMGQNIGTCITAILSSVSANKNAKRAAFIHLSFNLIGSIVFMSLIYLFNSIFPISFWNNQVNRGGIADFHLLFNVANTILFLPFTKLLVVLAEKVIKTGSEKNRRTGLDKRFLSTPMVALGQSEKEIINMAGFARTNLERVTDLILKSNVDNADKIEETEEILDELEVEITQYLTLIAGEPISNREHKAVTGLLHTVNDIERIGDHVANMSEAYLLASKQKTELSENAKIELTKIFAAAHEILDLSIASLESKDIDTAFKVEPLEEAIDFYNSELRERHIERLTGQTCTVNSGILFLDILTNVERISDHCSNIGVMILQESGAVHHRDTHNYTAAIHNDTAGEFGAQYNNYLEKYNM